MKPFMVMAPITDQMVMDQLCSAFEGGSNSWVTRVSAGPTAPPRMVDDIGHPWPVYCRAPVAEGYWLDVYEWGEAKPVRLDRAAIQRGLLVMQEKYPHRVAEVLDETGDADTGDCLLQCSLFGELKYG